MRIALLALLAACGGSSEPGADWSGKPLDTTITDKVNNTAFSIKLPKGMKPDGKTGPEEIAHEWKADVSDYFSEPSVMVSFASMPAKDLDGFIKGAIFDTDKEKVVKQEKLPDGLLITYRKADAGIVGVEIQRTKGDKSLTCRASQAKTGGVPNPEKTLAWLEQLCTSLTFM